MVGTFLRFDDPHKIPVFLVDGKELFVMAPVVAHSHALLEELKKLSFQEQYRRVGEMFRGWIGSGRDERIEWDGRHFNVRPMP